jgi:hypothetical protein
MVSSAEVPAKAVADKVVIDESAWTLSADGIDFPWHICAEGIEVTPLRHSSKVSVTFLTKSFEIDQTSRHPRLTATDALTLNGPTLTWDLVSGVKVSASRRISDVTVTFHAYEVETISAESA